MEKPFDFYHVVKNVDNEQILFNNFISGLKPLGKDTADSEQKQDSGLYFWSNKENSQRHIKFLTGELEGGRENEVSSKVGEIEFSIPNKDIEFPQFRFDIERNEVRAKFVENFMFPYLDCLNDVKSKKELYEKIELKEGETLIGFSKEEMRYVQHNTKSKIGSCLCLKVLKDGKETTRRAGVADVETASVWLAKERANFKNNYSNLLKYIFSNHEKADKLGLAFKYCGDKNLPVSKISIYEKNGTEYKKKNIYNKDIASMLLKNKER